MRGCFLAAAFVALTLPAAAAAHATLLRSVPADRSALRHAPAQARFVFDDVVRPASGIKAVRSVGTSVLAGRPRVIGGRTLVVPLARLRRGDYTVLWRVISDDGHTEAGVVTFSVGTGAPPGAAVLSASANPSFRDVVSRWLLFAGVLVAGGSAVFRLAVGPARIGALLVAFVAVFLGASGLLPHQGVFTSRFAGAYAVAALLAALGALAAAITAVYPPAEWVAWIAGVLVLPLPSIAGHSLDAGRPRIEVAVDVLHLAAAAVWTGGLVQLALSLRAAGERPALIRRFSTVALAAVAVLSATGLARALAELSEVSQLWSTGYGRLLVVKTVLLASLVGLGWLNRYRLLPRDDTAGLRRSVGGELVLLAGLVVAVALLTDTRPGRDRNVAAAAQPAPASGAPPLPPAGAIVLAREDGDNAVALSAEPRRLRVTVLGQSGLGINGLDVSVDGEQARSCGGGCYEREGAHSQVVQVRVEGRQLVFRVPEVAPPGASIVARATRIFRQLRSVSYVERLASDPRHHIVSTFTLEAPDRIHYRIRGGGSATVIGTRRWDGCAASQASALPQPSPIWGQPVTNARVLQRTRASEVVSFLNPRLPAWFLVRFDRRTLRPRRLKMTATAHFMHHTYTAFDAPRRIFPPRC
jgi:copper transport protein